MTPTRTSRIAAAAAVVALAGGLSACLRQASVDADRSSAPAPPSPAVATSAPGSPATRSGPSSSRPQVSADPWAPFTVPAGAWDAWKPVLTDVDPAGDAGALKARAGAAARRSFTTTVQSWFGSAEYAHRADHARLRFGAGGSGALEVHVEPLPTGEKTKGVFGLDGRAAVLCLDECVRVTGGEDPQGRPHLFDNLTDSALMQLATLEASQARTFDFLEMARTEGYAVGTARLESPVGALDCAVAARTTSALRALEGKALDPGETATLDSAVACVDARGLVVLTGDAAQPVVAFQDFRPGTDPDVARYPFPVRAYDS